ncbi:Pvc16 family protein [Streptomyces sp. NPDC102264]|uniref:Pvc16 family protein n=1 Tax=Streptomyces sp. NPDC102264 TaxID=3366149 RepID=UPI0038280601
MLDAVTLSLESWLRHCLPGTRLCAEAPDDPPDDPPAAPGAPPASPAPEGSGAGGGGLLRIRLYDVREEERSRSGQMVARGPDRAVVARMQPVRVFQFSYRLTAHGAGWREGQRLLGEVLRAGAEHPALPARFVHASLSGVGGDVPVPLVVAPPDPVPFPWTGLGPQPLPALHLVLLAPLHPSADTELEKAPGRIDLGASRTDGSRGTSRRSAAPPRNRIEERTRAESGGTTRAESGGTTRAESGGATGGGSGGATGGEAGFR